MMFSKHSLSYRLISHLTYLLGGPLILLGLLGILFGLPWSASRAAGSSPILIIVDDSYAPNPFGHYLGEIMRAEGINSYNLESLADMTATLLDGYELVILAEMDLNTAQAALLTDYLNNGGRIIAMRPDSEIAPLFGISGHSSTLTNSYLRISDSVTLTVGSIPPGTGLITQTLQIHGTADRYNLSSGTITLAQLYSDATTPTSYPAVVVSSSGRAVAFAYDLSRNIIYTRQGNPNNANIDVDGDGVVRTIDLFQTIGGEAPWVNRDKIPLPQADEQQRFFIRLVRHLVGFNMPLPQLWYFPQQAKTMLILTSDAHANGPMRHNAFINSVTAHNGNITVYITIGDSYGQGYLDTIRAMGHNFGIHPYALRSDDYPPYNVTNLYEGYAAMMLWWGFNYNPDHRSSTVRHHQVAWDGWADIAEEATTVYDIRLDTSFYHYGAWIQQPDMSWPLGYITGSGQSMKFVKEDGTILNIYQHLTHLVDEHLLQGITPGLPNLPAPQALAVSEALIDQSLTRDYAALMTQFHVDYYVDGNGDPAIGQEWAEGVMSYAQANGVPMWSADNWLAFTEMRYGSGFENITWNNSTGVLDFDLEVEASPGMTMTVMVPTTFKTRSLLEVRIDSVNQPITNTETIKGVDVVFVQVPAANGPVTYEIEAIYSSPTAIALRSLASQVRSGLATDVGALMLVLLGSATLVFLLERGRRRSLA